MSVSKVLAQEDLIKTLQLARQNGQQIVTTNGCFDVLHVGHLRYLQKARQEGDLLVVLLNSDVSVRNLKGPGRPIVPGEERAEMLAGLACVDYVALFSEETPILLLQQICPDVHVKGGDYDASSLPEAAILEKLGTRLVFVPMISGKSTTNLIQKICEVYQPL